MAARLGLLLALPLAQAQFTLTELGMTECPNAGTSKDTTVDPVMQGRSFDYDGWGLTCDDVNALPDKICKPTWSTPTSYSTRHNSYRPTDRWRKYICDLKDCSWDGTTCSDSPCHGKTGGACTSTATCMIHPDDNSKCVPKECGKWQTEDDCKADTASACGWAKGNWAGGGKCTTQDYKQCPGMDIMVFIDGSGSMGGWKSNGIKWRQSSKYHNGFTSLLMQLREWIRTLPLTGESHDASAGGDGFRVFFTQFGSSSYAFHPTGCAKGKCTDGHLSGRLDELEGDLEWMHEHWIAGSTYLKKTAQDVFDYYKNIPAAEKAGRKQVALLIADGAITDHNAAKDVMTKLEEKGVQLYAVIAEGDKPSASAPAYQDALDIVSDVKADHIVQLNVDQLKDGFFNTFCPIEELNECTEGMGKTECYDNNQDCDDPDWTELGDYVCSCIDPEEGADSKGAMATCTLNECKDGQSGHTKCTLEGQMCADDNQTMPGNFVCTCAGGAMGEGSEVGDTAACMLDECADGQAGKTMCDEQDCNDPVQAVLPGNDFECSCPTPSEGTPKTNGKAVCTTDECKMAPASDLYTVCKDAGQTCVEPSDEVDGNAFCQCPEPAEEKQSVPGELVAVADCSKDECMDHFATCEDHSQDCFDEFPMTKDDWVCLCRSPQTGTEGKQDYSMDCVYPPGDCDGSDCADAGQECNAMAGGSEYDNIYECTCTAPATGTPGMNGPAPKCELNECMFGPADGCDHCGKGVCPMGEQTCEDPNHEKPHDWKCRCDDPYKGVRVGKPVPTCMIDECKSSPAEGCAHCAGSTCTDAMQECDDHDDKVVGDWFCNCPDRTTSVPEKQAPVDECLLDECAYDGNLNKNLCEAEGQDCLDTDQMNAENWKCVCREPSTSSQEKGVVAECEIDECEVNDRINAKTCEMNMQTCADDEKTVPDSWKCECVFPSVGSEVTGAAECTLDECEAECDTCEQKPGEAATCEAAGQDCLDTDKLATAPSTWVCVCLDSPVRAPLAPVDVCPERDECRDESTAALSGEHIPRYSEEGCLCKRPWRMSSCDHGSATCSGPGAPDTDCTTGCCNPDGDTKGDWCFLDTDIQYNLDKTVCVNRIMGDGWDHCMASGLKPADGGLPMPFGRLPITGVPDDASNLCTDAGQLCVDPNPDHDDDWQCECLNPAMGAEGMQQPAACTLNECDQYASVCETHDQECVDPTDGVDETGDWYCHCKYGDMAQQPLDYVPSCQLNECEVECPTCAFDGTTTECQAAGQKCVDEKILDTELGEWVCVCAEPASGNKTRGVAVAECTLDECEVECDTCEQRAGEAATCEAAGQDCVDEHQAAADVKDWTCVCRDPTNGTATFAAVEVCQKDECAGNDACPVATQKCVEPDTGNDDDWFCECLTPAHGMQAMGEATCHYDECAQHGEMCRSHGQVCKDTEDTTLHTWQCECVLPDMGDPVMLMAATCVAPGECENNMVCSAHGQHCHDPDGPNNFECECLAPADGTAVAGGAAMCSINECEKMCATCEQTQESDPEVCAPHGQQCLDADQGDSADSLGNWVCQCVSPQTGTDVELAAADCVLDECIATCDTCANGACPVGEQTCDDEDKAVGAVKTWVCMCNAPSTSTATAGPADCLVDECADATGMPATTCDGAGQECKDTDHTETGNWACHCGLPTERIATAGAAQACDEFDECTTVCEHCADTDGAGTVCQAEKQTCRDDPPLNKHRNWVCECAAPATGEAEMRAAETADCQLDECADGVVCPLCADKGTGNVCKLAGQECVEGEKNMPGDWSCQCAAPLGHLSQRLGVVRCEFDECDDVMPGEDAPRGRVCKAEQQQCADNRKGTLEDFECTCASPKQGLKTGGAAECTLDECTLPINDEVCKAAGQECFDPETAKPSSWLCQCKSPSTGVATGHAAVCSTDECGANAEVCKAAGQECFDPEWKNDDDWECRCVVGLGSATKGEATCLIDECGTPENRAVCDMAGQECVDDEQDGDDNWQCRCADSDAFGVKSAAQCPVDECAEEANRAVCRDEGQECVDEDDMMPMTWGCACFGALDQVTNGKAVADCSEPSVTVAETPVPDVSVTEAVTAVPVVPDACAAIGEKCTCHTSDECAWLVDEDRCVGRQYGGCPTLDVVVLFDGSGSMIDDFDAMMTSLEEWVAGLPLSGEGAGTASPASGAHAGVRVAFVQYSGVVTDTVQAQTAPAGVGAGGRLSGSVDELRADLEWQRANYMADQSFIAQGLEKAAAILDASPKDGRRRALYIVSDGKLDDATAAEAAIAGVPADVEVFGVVVRRSMAHTAEDIEAEATLKPLVSEPQDDHFINIDVEKMGAASAPLTTICDPTAPFGRYLVPHSGAADFAECGDVDECTTAGKGVCDEAVSHCHDTDYTTLDSWECVCNEAGEGAQALGPAACAMLNECDLYVNVAVCETGHPPQLCVDENLRVPNTWECHCYLENGLGGAWHLMDRYPNCATFGDCSDDAISAVCENAGQRCYDPDTSTPGDWECMCSNFEQGAPGMQQAAVCGVNECSKSRCLIDAECGYNRCRSVDDHCVDADTQQLGNWECAGGASVERGTGSDDSDVECGSWLECWWWVILLLVCCSCCCVALTLLIVVKKKNEQEDEPWNKMGEKNDMSGEELSNKEGEQSLLASEVGASSLANLNKTSDTSPGNSGDVEDEV